MKPLKLFSPAKLNLFFRVLKKRPDGYHDISSLFQAISLGDYLTIVPSDKEELICDHPAIPNDKTNLIIKAAHLFYQKTGCKDRFTFALEKHIPIEAGLGGGSSNAATTLWGLNQLCKTQVPDDILASWGAELGSDIPFFFSTGRAICEGRGERVTSVEPIEGSLWVAKPKMSLSTATVYKACRIQPLSKEFYFNDLEEAAFKMLPELKGIKTQIQALGFDQVVMTGSGTAFVCLGKAKHLELEGVDFWPVDFVHRKIDGWYEFPR